MQPGAIRAIDYEVMDMAQAARIGLRDTSLTGDLRATTELGVLRCVDHQGRKITVIGQAGHVLTLVASARPATPMAWRSKTRCSPLSSMAGWPLTDGPRGIAPGSLSWAVKMPTPTSERLVRTEERKMGTKTVNGYGPRCHPCDLCIEMRYSLSGPRSKNQGHLVAPGHHGGDRSRPGPRRAAMTPTGQTPVIGPPGRITCWLCNRKCRRELEALSAPANGREARVFTGVWQFGIEGWICPKCTLRRESVGQN